MPSPLTDAAVQIALSQLGVKEVGGNNRGPDVEAYLASVGLPPGDAWCASFAFWCFRQAAQQAGVVNPFPRTGGALRVWSLADKACRVVTPAVGCVYVLDHGHGLGHVGIVVSVDERGIGEVSGNTNEAGSREGNAVALHVGDPEEIHHGKHVGWLDFGLAAQQPVVA